MNLGATTRTKDIKGQITAHGVQDRGLLCGRATQEAFQPRIRGIKQHGKGESGKEAAKHSQLSNGVASRECSKRSDEIQ